MADVPLQNNQAIQPMASVEPRDMDDIDRELEAYLEQKRKESSRVQSGSIDEQLAKVREKYGATGEPATTKKDEKKEEEANADSRGESRTSQEKPQKKLNIPTPPPHATKRESLEEPQGNPGGNPPPSHEDLIRSLEQKYSASQKEENNAASFQKKDTQLKRALSAATPLSANQESEVPKGETRTAQERTEKEVLKGSEARHSLAELRAFVDASRAPFIDEILKQAGNVSEQDVAVIVNSFSSRFKRNLERKKLYEETQASLENDLKTTLLSLKESEELLRETNARSRDVFTKARPIPTPQGKEVVSEVPQKDFNSKAAPSYGTKKGDSQSPALSPHNARSDSAEKQFEILDSQKAGAPLHTVNQESSMSPVENKDDTETSREDALFYQTHFNSLSEKPTVLMYDPAQGFVRKVADPGDSSLVFSYARSNTAFVASVFDTQGNSLGEIEIPL